LLQQQQHLSLTKQQCRVRLQAAALVSRAAAAALGLCVLLVAAKQQLSVQGMQVVAELQLRAKVQG
jgi:hypothetical protein